MSGTSRGRPSVGEQRESTAAANPQRPPARDYRPSRRRSQVAVGGRKLEWRPAGATTSCPTARTCVLGGELEGGPQAEERLGHGAQDGQAGVEEGAQELQLLPCGRRVVRELEERRLGATSASKKRLAAGRKAPEWRQFGRADASGCSSAQLPARPPTHLVHDGVRVAVAQELRALGLGGRPRGELGRSEEGGRQLRAEARRPLGRVVEHVGEGPRGAHLLVQRLAPADETPQLRLELKGGSGEKEGERPTSWTSAVAYSSSTVGCNTRCCSHLQAAPFAWPPGSRRKSAVAPPTSSA